MENKPVNDDKLGPVYVARMQCIMAVSYLLNGQTEALTVTLGEMEDGGLRVLQQASIKLLSMTMDILEERGATQI